MKFRRCLFKIYPAFINTQKKIAYSMNKTFNTKSFKEADKRRTAVDDQLEKVESEYKQNVEAFHKFENVPIKYGETIQLMHVASNKFLKCVQKEAEIERENYKLILDKHSSSDSMFKIEASYKH